jgi:heterotetrameric sarcosine oxidase gamma subunit
VSDFCLTAQPVLDGFAHSYDGAALEEVTDLAIVSMAVPRSGLTKLNVVMKSAYGVAFPVPGDVALSKNGKIRFLGMNTEQAFVIFDYAGADAAKLVGRKLKNKAYVSLQSDNWVGLRISGPQARNALERICPLDLHEDVFGKNRVARTIMEHLGVIILRQSDGDFLLLSASSSAKSFLHAIETSIENVT